MGHRVEIEAGGPSVTTFYLLAFGISWVAWLPVLAGSFGVAMFQSPLWKLALVPVAAGPALAAALAFPVSGHPIPPGRFKALFEWRVGVRWYAFALLIPPALLLIAATVDRLGSREAAPIIPALAAAPALFFLLQSVITNPLEEIGWRGFALPRLEKRYGAIVASLIVGILWALWHLPLFVWSGSPMSGYPVWPWVASLLAETFVLTWLYNSASRSVLITSLFHISMNLASVVIGVRSFEVLAATFVVAVIVLFACVGRTLSSQESR